MTQTKLLMWIYFPKTREYCKCENRRCNLCIQLPTVRAYLPAGHIDGLSSPGNENNLVPPFLMSEAGLDVNPKSKILRKSPTVEDHSIYDDETGLWIPLSLNGICSSFITWSLTADEMSRPDDYEMVFLTPESPHCNPYDESYALNKAAHLDSRGEMTQMAPARHDLLEEADIAALEAERPNLPTPVEQFNDKSTHIDTVIASSIIGSLNGEPDHDSILKFKDDSAGPK